MQQGGNPQQIASQIMGMVKGSGLLDNPDVQKMVGQFGPNQSIHWGSQGFEHPSNNAISPLFDDQINNRRLLFFFRNVERSDSG